jgi:hypothetical protein
LQISYSKTAASGETATGNKRAQRSSLAAGPPQGKAARGEAAIRTATGTGSPRNKRAQRSSLAAGPPQGKAARGEAAIRTVI